MTTQYSKKLSMPNPLKAFGRRRSSGNALEFPPETTAPSQPSFRVLERSEKNTHSFGGQDGRPRSQVNLVRPFTSPLRQIRGKSAEDLGLGPNRGSAGTTNSGSSGYYDSPAESARHSSSSTLPSSLDQEREPEEEELFPPKSTISALYRSVSPEPEAPLPRHPTFTLRAARAFSFGNKQNRQASQPKDLPPLPPIPLNGAPRSPERSHSPTRERAMTTSSYASTAVPTKPEPNWSLHSTFGDDFGDEGFANMFSNFGKNRSAQQSREHLPTPPPPVVGSFHRTESPPMFHSRTYSRQALTPSPSALCGSRNDAGSPYSLDGRNSNDGLFSSSTLSLPILEDGPPVPAHRNRIASTFLGGSKGAYSLVAPERSHSPGSERLSPDSQSGFMADKEQEREEGLSTKQTQGDDGDRWMKRVELHDGPALSETASNQSFKTAGSGKPNRNPVPFTQASTRISRLGAISPGSEEGGSLFDSSNTTPKAAKLTANTFSDEPLFESSPLGPPSRAMRPNSARTDSGTPKKITKAQFDILQRHGDSSQEHSEDEVREEDEADDYEDDAERAKRVTRQRRKQEATMAVYRQQMKKVTGGGPSDLPTTVRPALDRSSNSAPAASMSALHLGGLGGVPPPDAVKGKQDDDDDEDVPLGILQAHGFPSSGRPPTRMAEAEAQHRTSVAGSVAGGGAGQGNLPPFARRLPADPYFGASLVNPAHRESLAFGGNASVYGGAPSMHPQTPQAGHPAGLVGVIAGEERARAARRGSPNPVTGTYGQGLMPLPSNMPQQIPGMPGLPRNMSMGSVAPSPSFLPSGFQSMSMMPGMPQMPMMSPSDYTQQQMQQFMQMQMQFMQNMMAMQQQQQLVQSPQPQPPIPDYLGVPLGNERPTSMAGQAATFGTSISPGQGRAMTMMNPPTRWELNNGRQQPRPMSAMPSNRAPSVYIMNGGGQGAVYTPSIAPSERSNVGMPSRYRPVTMNGDSATGRSQSMTSSLTLQATSNQPGGQGAEGRQQEQQPKSTIRIVDKPKGTPKVTSRPVDEDEDEGWAEMAKKRNERKFGWRRKGKTEPPLSDPSLSDLYSDFE